jgi:hypothetical protein
VLLTYYSLANDLFDDSDRSSCFRNVRYDNCRVIKLKECGRMPLYPILKQLTCLVLRKVERNIFLAAGPFKQK